MALSPVPHYMHVRKSAPRDRTRMLRDNNLKLSGDRIEERGKRAEDTVHTFDIGRPISLAGRFRSLLHRRPCLREIHLARLVDHKEIGNGTLAHTKEVLMQRKHPGNMVANPILAAANLPEKIGSAG